MSKTPTEIDSSFEFSLSEIKNQLQTMGIYDISSTALQTFQKDLQEMIGNDSADLNLSKSSKTSKKSNFANTISQGYKIQDDDAASILSNASSRTRKTIRNGQVSVTKSFVNESFTSLSESLDSTITEYLNCQSARPCSSPLKEKKKLSKSIELSSSTDSTLSLEDPIDRATLYDDKIDDFVKALLDGNDSVLNDTAISELTDAGDGLNLATGLNKKMHRMSSGDKKSNYYNKNLNIEELPPPPSFIRPSTAPVAGRRVGWHDPVKRHAEYKKYWNKQPKCNAARDHKRTTKVKWQVRNELAELVKYNDEKMMRIKDDISNEQYINKFMTPADKKRNDIRWQVRNIMNNSGGY